MSSIIMLGTRILVTVLDEESKTEGGFLIADTAKEKPTKGKCVASGPGSILQNGERVPNSVSVGQTVLFGKNAGTEVKFNNEKYLVVDEKDIIAILVE